MTDQDTIDSLVADICAQVRVYTSGPAEGILVLGTAIYMLWRMSNTDNDFSGFMKDFDESIKSLHFANDIKGTA